MKFEKALKEAFEKALEGEIEANAKRTKLDFSLLYAEQETQYEKKEKKVVPKSSAKEGKLNCSEQTAINLP